MKSVYKGFTLIEMLIVMAIIIILMAIGLIAGPAIINNANSVRFQGIVKQLNQANTAYFTENNTYPYFASAPSWDKYKTAISNYIDTFDGGNDATYLYFVSDNAQRSLVCVSLGGIDDSLSRGYYCSGDGFNGMKLYGGSTTLTITNKDVKSGTTEYTALKAATAHVKCNWDKATKACK